MTDIASLVLSIDSSQAKKAETSLDGLTAAGDKAEATTKRLASASDVLASAARGIAAAYGALQLGKYAAEAALLNARYETLGVAMTVVGRNVGYTAEQMEGAAKALQRTGISMLESRQSAMQLVQAHIDLSASTKLARVAQDAAVIGNINSSEAFGRLVRGIQSAEVEILRGIGINVQFEAGYKQMAATLSKNVDELTENEKTQSRLNQVMAKGSDIAGVYEASMDTAGKQLQSMKRYTEDLKVTVGGVFNEALTVGVMAFTQGLKGANEEAQRLAANKDMETWGEGVTNVMVFVGDNINNLIGAMRAIGVTVAALAAASNLEIWDNAGRAAIKEGYDADIAAIYAGEDRFSKALEARRAARKESADKDARSAATIAEDRLGRYAQDRHTYADTPAVAKASKGPDEYTKLIAGIKEKMAVEQAELAGVGRLNEAERLREELYSKIDSGIIKLSLSQKLKLDAQLDDYNTLVKLSAEEKAAYESAMIIARARSDMRNKETDSIEAFTSAQSLGYVEAVNAANAQLQAEEKRLAQYGLSRTQIEALNIAELELQLTRKTAGSEAAKSLEAQIEARRKLLGVMSQVEDVEATTNLWKSIEQTAHTTFTNIFQGGQDAFTKLRDVLKSTLLDLLYQMTVKKWIIGISATVTGAGAASTVSGSGGALDWLTNFGSSTTKTVERIGETMINTGSETLNKVGSWLLNNSSGVGNFASGASAVVNYLNAIDLWTQGKRGEAIGSAAGQYFGGPIGSAVGRFVGSKFDYTVEPKGNALVVNAGAGGASAVANRSDFTQTGGWFGGGVTNNSSWAAADAGTTGYIDESIKNVTAANTAYADALGLNSEALKNYTAQLEINVTGMDSAAAQAAIDAEIARFQADQLSSAYGDVLATVAKTGETTTETITRIITDLTVVNSTFSNLGWTLYDVGVAGGAAASGLVSAMGGLQAFQAQMSSYYSNFYTKEEQRQATINSVLTDLNAAGITGYTSEQIGGASRADIRAAVEQIVSGRGTPEGDARAAAAIAAANRLSAVTPAMDSVTDSANNAAVAMGGGGGGGGGRSLADAASSLADALFDEARRIRELVTSENGLAGFAEAQARFAIGTAASRAGDQEAAKALPDLSRAMLDLAENSVSSKYELQLLRAQTAASLWQTGVIVAGATGGTIPQYDIGTPYVPFDQTARLHRGERVLTAAENAQGGADMSEVVALLEEIRDNSRDSRNMLERIITVGVTAL